MDEDKEDSNIAPILIGILVLLWFFIFTYFCGKNPIICLSELIFGY